MVQCGELIGIQAKGLPKALDDFILCTLGIDLFKAAAPEEPRRIVLPVDVTSVGFLRADWDDSLLLSADEAARNIVRQIRDERFWPPTDPPPNFCDDLAVICQDHALSEMGFRPARRIL